MEMQSETTEDLMEPIRVADFADIQAIRQHITTLETALQGAHPESRSHRILSRNLRSLRRVDDALALYDRFSQNV